MLDKTREKMNKKFNNADELNQYLDMLEKRVESLEKENRQLIKRTQPIKLPQTNIINPNFIKRAFTVWGHFFIANAIISIFFAIIYFCLTIFTISSLLSGISVTTPVPNSPIFPIP
ncbi:MAG: hypothetical protein KF758_01515 [Anaerolineales bacterium]|nr:hypothetical protein [Anaerolineales bacterium]MBX3035565.1 hypothetical protein [Anaerolineales bacterium]